MFMMMQRSGDGMKTILLYASLIGTVLLMGTLIGIQNAPGAWYESLQKPVFTPPNGAFGPVWTVLYTIIGWVGARKLQRGGAGGLWILQITLNFAWTPVFFGLQAPLAGLVMIAALLWAIIAFIRAEWHTDRLSALLFLPYAGWVCIAASLNIGIVLMN